MDQLQALNLTRAGAGLVILQLTGHDHETPQMGWSAGVQGSGISFMMLPCNRHLEGLRQIKVSA